MGEAEKKPFAASSEQAVKRKPRGKPFKPGQSGNPAGRVKKTAELLAIEELAKVHSEVALAALADEATNGRGAPRVAAANALLDRAWGEPIKRVISDSTSVVTRIDQRLRAADDILADAMSRGANKGNGATSAEGPVLPAVEGPSSTRH